jgi:hypothetical protein
VSLPSPITQTGSLIAGSLATNVPIVDEDSDSGFDIEIQGGGSFVYVIVEDQGADGAEALFFKDLGVETVSVCNDDGPGGCAVRLLTKEGDIAEFSIPAADHAPGFILRNNGTEFVYHLGLTISAPADVDQYDQVVVGSDGGLCSTCAVGY